MNNLDRITMDSSQMNGQPCLRGMRLRVRRVLEIASLYPDAVEKRLVFPEIEDEDLRQALKYAEIENN